MYILICNLYLCSIKVLSLSLSMSLSMFSFITVCSNCNCCVRQDGTRYDNKCAFNYSDNLVVICQVTPVTIQTKKTFRNNTNNNRQIT